MDNGTQAGQGILSVSIKELGVLSSAYMPFLANGGLFVPTPRHYELGDEVFILLNLMEEAERIPVSGTVVWITPPGAQGLRTAGIGIHFSEPGCPARTKIEEYLKELKEPERSSHTL